MKLYKIVSEKKAQLTCVQCVSRSFFQFGGPNPVTACTAAASRSLH